MTSTVKRDAPRSWRRAVGPPLTTAALLLLLLLMPTPQTTRLLGMLRDATHLIVGALLAYALDRALRPAAARPPPPLVALLPWIATLAFLWLVEIVQPLFGRTASHRDLWTGAAGAAALLLGRAAARGDGWRRPALAGAALVVLGAGLWVPVRIALDVIRQRQAFPLLASFEHPAESSRWTVRGGRQAIRPGHATDGAHSLEVTLRAGDLPSAIMVWPVHDWTGYDALALDLELEGTTPLDLLLKVEDLDRGSGKNARSLTPLRLSPGPNAVRVPLAAIAAAPAAGPLDLSRIAGLALVAEHLDADRRFWLDRVRLLRSEPDVGGDAPEPDPETTDDTEDSNR